MHKFVRESCRRLLDCVYTETMRASTSKTSAGALSKGNAPWDTDNNKELTFSACLRASIYFLTRDAHSWRTGLRDVGDLSHDTITMLEALCVMARELDEQGLMHLYADPN